MARPECELWRRHDNVADLADSWRGLPLPSDRSFGGWNWWFVSGWHRGAAGGDMFAHWFKPSGFVAVFSRELGRSSWQCNGHTFMGRRDWNDNHARRSFNKRWSVLGHRNRNLDWSGFQRSNDFGGVGRDICCCYWPYERHAYWVPSDVEWCYWRIEANRLRSAFRVGIGTYRALCDSW